MLAFCADFAPLPRKTRSKDPSARSTLSRWHRLEYVSRTARQERRIPARRFAHTGGHCAIRRDWQHAAASRFRRSSCPRPCAISGGNANAFRCVRKRFMLRLWDEQTKISSPIDTSPRATRTTRKARRVTASRDHRSDGMHIYGASPAENAGTRGARAIPVKLPAEPSGATTHRLTRSQNRTCLGRFMLRT